MEKDIERLEKIVTTKFNNDYSIDSEDKKAIENLIARNKELEVKLKLSNELYDDACICLLDTIPKSKVREEFEKEFSHSNCFNLGDMQDLLDRILEGD